MLPPPSYFQAVQDALDSLPDELPVKVRPPPPAGAAHLCGFGRLPGGGRGGRYRHQPGKPRIDGEYARGGADLPGAEPPGGTKALPHPRGGEQHPLRRGRLAGYPAFEPAIFPLENNLGLLTVQNATCDGSTLVLELGLELWDTTMTSDSITVFRRGFR